MSLYVFAIYLLLSTTNGTLGSSIASRNGIPNLRFVSERSASTDPKTNIPEIEVTFTNGVTQRMILSHYNAIPKSNSADASRLCNYLGHLEGEEMESSVAVTGCLTPHEASDEKMHVTLISKHSPFHKTFSMDHEGTVKHIQLKSTEGYYEMSDKSPQKRKSSSGDSSGWEMIGDDAFVNVDEERAASAVTSSEMETVPTYLTVDFRLGYDKNVKDYLENRGENVDNWLSEVMTHAQAHYMHSSLQHQITFQNDQPTLFLDQYLGSLGCYGAREALVSEVRRLNEPQVDLYAWISDFTSGCAGIAAGIGTACDNNEHRKVSVTAGPSRANAVVETAETLVHEIGHNLGMYHDFVDFNTPYTKCRKHLDSSQVYCTECYNYQPGNSRQPIGPLTGNPGDCCNGLMGYMNHPHYWSDCSIRFFRQHYISQQWSQCIEETPTVTTPSPASTTTTPTTPPLTTATTTTPTTATTTTTNSATITINCGSTITEVDTPETTITSPNYPSIYPNNQECQTVIRFNQGQRVSLEFLAFNLESHSSCSWDWLEIRDGSTSSASLIGSKLCGDQVPGPIQSSGNTLYIRFRSDGSVNRSGFQLKVKVATGPGPATTPSPPSGSCTGNAFNFDDYFSWQNHMNYLTCLSTTYPDRAQIINIGSSIENREIRVIKIGKPRADGITKPAVWIDGGIHAREWISPAAVEYVIGQFVENYGASGISHFVDTFDIYVAPVLNPDGYEYSRNSNRYWRKNRRQNSGSSCVGVDLNRNWGYEWGGQGASSDPCSNTYRGTGPFSEPETAAVRDFINTQKQNQEFLMFLTYHSYGQYVLYGWGYAPADPPNKDELDEMGRIAAEAIRAVNGKRYSVGGAAELLYSAAGGSDDWALGSAGFRYSFTMELPPSGSPGFVLPANQILPVGRETFAGITAMMTKLMNETDIPTTASPVVTSTTTTTTQTSTVTTTTVQPTTTSTSSTSNVTCNGSPTTDWSCCDYNEPCNEGGGDCDHDSDCIGALKCGNNNCQPDFSGPGSNWASAADCCYDPSHDCRGSPSTDWNCCSDAFPCLVGQGDCDNDQQCEGDLVCGPDNCLRDFSTASSNWVIGADCCTSATGIPPTTTATFPPSTTVTTTTIPTTTTTLGGNPSEITIDCDSPFDDVTTTGTTILSPNHPSNYENSKDCQVTIRSSERVRIRFEAFNVESSSTCAYDWLEVRDGDGVTSSPIIGSKLCGTDIPAPIESSGDSMTLVFHTDGSVVRSGFKILTEVATGVLTTTTLPTTQLPTGECGIKPAGRIVGGSEASPYSLPWQVGLVRPGSDRPFCGGTLISPRHVLTAAHCTGVNGGNWDVMVGEHDKTDTSDGTRHTKCRHLDHPNYHQPVSRANDFAIVHLDQPVIIGTRAAPACLPNATLAGNFLDDKTMSVSGWGALCSGCSSPDELHVVNVPGVSNDVCNQRYGGGISDEMICAGSVNGGIDSCQGDSGGPLTYNDGGRATLVGVVSWGRGCALATHPGVYARVTEILPWINEQLAQTC